tara:strand:+ start:1726 stop:1971 length:246 start_codon:yes stop_codon:yes gene_type:complete
MEFLYLLAGFIIAYVIIKIFSKIKDSKSSLKIEEDEDESKYLTWTKALNLIQDQILILNKNKIVILFNSLLINFTGKTYVT